MWILGVLGATLWCGGCARRVDDPAAIAGTYVLNGGSARDELVLQPRGRYVRRYSPPAGQALTDSGTWEMDRSSGEPRLVLSNFVPRWRSQHFPEVPIRPGYWSTYATQRPFGAVRLNVSADSGLEYVRQ
jgi:hypothetical protein